MNWDMYLIILYIPYKRYRWRSREGFFSSNWHFGM